MHRHARLNASTNTHTHERTNNMHTHFLRTRSFFIIICLFGTALRCKNIEITEWALYHDQWTKFCLHAFSRHGPSSSINLHNLPWKSQILNTPDASASASQSILSSSHRNQHQAHGWLFRKVYVCFKCLN